MPKKTCDCGAEKAPKDEACARCLAAETAQGLRVAPLALGVKARGPTAAEYQRRRRAAKRAAGMCSTCSARPAAAPGKTCLTCADKMTERRDDALAKGLCVKCLTAEAGARDTQMCEPCRVKHASAR